MSKELVNKYFPEIDFDENSYRDEGYIPLSVSAFDHILNELEADNCINLNYSTAIKKRAVN
ncbi:hypothetical protein [Caballeronia sp. LZ035]|uniref:hypothetical protein n=1 Tax=Caballeronia sp. LZ035 TaxID=3038568 RepID=UPI00285CD337|nr:hypothetical protein [Caballeronia sp. LZ035]MDR5760001.1 hypothetical protein [Caballeronia sp. LZ035]